LAPRIPDDRDANLGEALTPAQRAAFLQLPVYDQRHLCAVYRALRSRDPDDHELLQAGLLHDLGKAALNGRVRLIDRVAIVVLNRIAPRLSKRLTSLPCPRWRLGLALAVHHPALGADWARTLSCSERTCWLIEHHADRPVLNDDALIRLAAADESA
jgi:hypothetical protein